VSGEQGAYPADTGGDESDRQHKHRGDRSSGDRDKHRVLMAKRGDRPVPRLGERLRLPDEREPQKGQ
jgi:hypothetical protein